MRRTPTYVVFEQVVEWTVAAEGRYAVRVDVPRPPPPLLPVLASGAEIYPRFYLERVGAKPEDARVVFETFTETAAGVGIPGDAASALTVAGTTDPRRLVGGGTGIQLRKKPDFLAPDDLAVGGPAVRGPAVAAGFAGGVAACLIQSGAAVQDMFGIAGVEPGRPIVLPPEWFRRLPQRP